MLNIARNNYTEVVNDLLSHRFRLKDEQKILRYAMLDGDLKKVRECTKNIMWHKQEIERLTKLLDQLNQQQRRMA